MAEERRSRKLSVETKLAMIAVVIGWLMTIVGFGYRYGALEERINNLRDSVEHLRQTVEADERAKLIAVPTIVIPQTSPKKPANFVEKASVK